LLDRQEGSTLLFLTRDSSSVSLTSVGPSGLEDNDILGVTTVALGQSDLILDEGTGTAWGNSRVEERMDVDTNNVHVWADVSGDDLEDVDGLGGGDLSVVTGSADLGGNDSHVFSELLTSAEAVEDRLVTDDEKLDLVPLAPGDDVLDLGVSGRNTSSLDEDTEDELEVVLGAGVSDALESAAVGGVETDRLESLCADGLDISIYIRSTLAEGIVIVW